MVKFIKSTLLTLFSKKEPRQITICSTGNYLKTDQDTTNKNRSIRQNIQLIHLFLCYLNKMMYICIR